MLLSINNESTVSNSVLMAPGGRAEAAATQQKALMLHVSVQQQRSDYYLTQLKIIRSIASATW